MVVAAAVAAAVRANDWAGNSHTGGTNAYRTDIGHWRYTR